MQVSLFSILSPVNLNKIDASIIPNWQQESFSEAPGRFVSPSNNRSGGADQQLYLPGRILQVEERQPLDSTQVFFKSAIISGMK